MGGGRRQTQRQTLARRLRALLDELGRHAEARQCRQRRDPMRQWTLVQRLWGVGPVSVMMDLGFARQIAAPWVRQCLQVLRAVSVMWWTATPNR